MNYHHRKLHYYQIELLKKLSTHPRLRFNQLLIEGLESEHMNYHLKLLIEDNFITKLGPHYTLTDAGKDYSNLLDEQTDIIEKQPKTSIVIRGVRKNIQGQIEHLLNKRLRQPYYGKVGRITGKVRFGEQFVQAAKRELYEETGLIAQNFTLEEIYHKLRHREDGVWVQDVIFYIFFVTNFSGQLIEQTPYQQNFWITETELQERSDLDPYDDLVLDNRIQPKKLILQEHLAIAEGF